jgi:hypothetical protein
VHGVDVVSGEDENLVDTAVLYETQVLVDRLCGTSVPVHLPIGAYERVEEGDAAHHTIEVPWFADTDMACQRARIVLRYDSHLPDSGVDAVA